MYGDGIVLPRFEIDGTGRPSRQTGRSLIFFNSLPPARNDDRGFHTLSTTPPSGVGLVPRAGYRAAIRVDGSRVVSIHTGWLARLLLCRFDPGCIGGRYARRRSGPPVGSLLPGPARGSVLLVAAPVSPDLHPARYCAGNAKITQYNLFIQKDLRSPWFRSAFLRKFHILFYVKMPLLPPLSGALLPSFSPLNRLVFNDSPFTSPDLDRQAFLFVHNKYCIRCSSPGAVHGPGEWRITSPRGIQHFGIAMIQPATPQFLSPPKSVRAEPWLSSREAP